MAKSELPLCEAIGSLEERYPLNWWPWNQYHVLTVAHMNLMLRRSTSPTSGRCPLHGISCDAHEQFLTGLRAISPRLPQLEWCWLGFDLLWLWPVLYWIMSSQLCQAQRDIFDEEFDRVDAGTMTAARGFRAAGRRTRIAPRWWARNGPASVPASACLHLAWFVFVLGVLVTSRDHWWNTDSFSFTQAEEPPVRQQPVYAQRHELRGLCGGCDGLVTACYGFVSFFSDPSQLESSFVAYSFRNLVFLTLFAPSQTKWLTVCGTRAVLPHHRGCFIWFMYSLVCIPSGPKADWAQKLSCMLEAVNKFLIHQADVQHPKLTQACTGSRKIGALVISELLTTSN